MFMSDALACTVMVRMAVCSVQKELRFSAWCEKADQQRVANVLKMALKTEADEANLVFLLLKLSQTLKLTARLVQARKALIIARRRELTALLEQEDRQYGAELASRGLTIVS